MVGGARRPAEPRRLAPSGKRRSCRFPHWLGHLQKRQECRFPHRAAATERGPPAPSLNVSCLPPLVSGLRSHVPPHYCLPALPRRQDGGGWAAHIAGSHSNLRWKRHINIKTMFNALYLDILVKRLCSFCHISVTLFCDRNVTDCANDFAV